MVNRTSMRSERQDRHGEKWLVLSGSPHPHPKSRSSPFGPRLQSQLTPMDISGHRRFLPTFIPLDPPQNGALQFPGLQIPLDKARKTRVEQYPQERKAIEEVFGRIGSYEREFVSCTVTGFLVPFVPRISGFHLFGKGLGGLFRNIVVSSLTAGVGGHVHSSLFSANLVLTSNSRTKNAIGTSWNEC
jgi:hypothetical protein